MRYEKIILSISPTIPKGTVGLLGCGETKTWHRARHRIVSSQTLKAIPRYDTMTSMSLPIALRSKIRSVTFFQQGSQVLTCPSTVPKPLSRSKLFTLLVVSLLHFSMNSMTVLSSPRQTCSIFTLLCRHIVWCQQF